MPRRKGRATATSLLIAVTCAAVIAVLSASGGVWLLGMLLPASVIVLRRRGTLAAIRGGALVAIPAVALSAPLFAAGGVVPPTSSPVTSDTAKGNLVEPLSWLQVFGVWPEGDFRFEPDDMLVTYVLVGAVALAAMHRPRARLAAARDRRVGVRRRARSRRRIAIVAVGSPWIDAKALATASPAVVFAALVGAGLLAAGGRRVAGAVVGLVVCGGVLWSNVLAYNEVNLAPYDRHAELEQIGDRIAGEGPALMTEYEPYGVRHFLRKADAEGASELRRRVVPLRSGRPLRKLGTADIDEFELAGHPRIPHPGPAPVAGREPATVGLPAAVARPVLRRVAAGAWAARTRFWSTSRWARAGDPAARPACAQVRALGRRAAAAGGRLAVARASRGPCGSTWRGRRDREPGRDPTGRRACRARSTPARRRASTPPSRVRRPGRHLVYVGGAFRRAARAVGRWAAGLEPGGTA